MVLGSIVRDEVAFSSDVEVLEVDAVTSFPHIVPSAPKTGRI